MFRESFSGFGRTALAASMELWKTRTATGGMFVNSTNLTFNVSTISGKDRYQIAGHCIPFV
jgi:hypothetical protein